MLTVVALLAQLPLALVTIAIIVGKIVAVRTALREPTADALALSLATLPVVPETVKTLP